MTNVISLLANHSADALPEEDISSERLSRLLQTAFLDPEFDEDGDIYVTEGLDIPAWIHVDHDKKRIVFVTYLKVEPGDANWLERVNEMNATIAVPQFSYRRDAVWGTYWVSYDGGLNVRQFIKMLRTFAGAFVAGFHIFDRENSMVSGSVAQT